VIGQQRQLAQSLSVLLGQVAELGENELEYDQRGDRPVKKAP